MLKGQHLKCIFKLFRRSVSVSLNLYFEFFSLPRQTIRNYRFYEPCRSANHDGSADQRRANVRD
jgi:hypothetical protein